MKQLSKSKYTTFCQCPKALWLRINKPDAATPDSSVEARFEQGNKVGDLAMGLFGEYKEAHAEKPDGSLDLAAMVEQTQRWMQEGEIVFAVLLKLRRKITQFMSNKQINSKKYRNKVKVERLVYPSTS